MPASPDVVLNALLGELIRQTESVRIIWQSSEQPGLYTVGTAHLLGSDVEVVISFAGRATYELRANGCEWKTTADKLEPLNAAMMNATAKLLGINEVRAPVPELPAKPPVTSTEVPTLWWLVCAADPNKGWEWKHPIFQTDDAEDRVLPAGDALLMIKELGLQPPPRDNVVAVIFTRPPFSDFANCPADWPTLLEDPDFAEVEPAEPLTEDGWYLLAARSSGETWQWKHPVRMPVGTVGPITHASRIDEAIKTLGLAKAPLSWYVAIAKPMPVWIAGAIEWPRAGLNVDESPMAERLVPRQVEETKETPKGGVNRRYWLVITVRGRRHSIPIPPRIQPPADPTPMNLAATLGYIGGGSVPEGATIALTSEPPVDTMAWVPQS